MSKKITDIQQRDTILASTLLILIAYYIWGEPYILHLMAAVLVLGMSFPRLFTPAAKLWFGFSSLLGTVMSRVVMAVIFFALVLPVGCIRRCLGYDSMAIKKWKKSSDSVFIVRNHTYSPKDLEHPY